MLDFYCHECKLAIELDGEQHKKAEAKEYDEGRTKLLAEYGIKMLRFWNEEVMTDAARVITKIKEALTDR